MPERGRKKASQAGQLSQGTGSREREWLLGRGELGKTMGIHFSPVTFSFLSSLHYASVLQVFLEGLTACNQLCLTL